MGSFALLDSVDDVARRGRIRIDQGLPEIGEPYEHGKEPEDMMEGKHGQDPDWKRAHEGKRFIEAFADGDLPSDGMARIDHDLSIASGAARAERNLISPVGNEAFFLRSPLQSVDLEGGDAILGFLIHDDGFTMGLPKQVLGVFMGQSSVNQKHRMAIHF